MAALRHLPAVLARQAGPEPVLTLAVDAGLVGFQGHFPGHPILPGVVQVDWAARFGTEAFGPLGAFAGLAQVKFHRAIRPDRAVDLHLAWDAPGGRLRFAYRAGPELLSSGVVRFGPGPDGDLPAPGPDRPVDPTPLPIPHQPPMRLLAALVEAGERHATALAQVEPGAWYAGPDGAAPGWIGLEWMAQAAAAHVGHLHLGRPGGPRPGYLLGTRSCQCDRPSFPAGAVVEVAATLLDADPGGLSAYAGELRWGGRQVARADLKVFEA